MKDWHDKGHLIDKLAEARKDARDTAPRSGGNDALEAAMLLGMLYALDKIHQEEDTSAATPSEAPAANAPEAAAPAADQTEAPTEAPAEETPGPVTEEEPEDDHPHRGRRKRS
jgi:hypothetical protein